MCIETLGRLASNYNLRVQVLPSMAVLVYSMVGEWIAESDQYDNIRLCHFNNPRRNCRTHPQINFYDGVNNFDYVFKYIKGHDDAVLTGTKHMKSLK